MLEDVGRRIAEVRVERGWTQEEAAHRFGISARMMRKLEAGANTSIRRLIEIAGKLGVDVSALFETPKTRAKRQRGRPRRRE